MANPFVHVELQTRDLAVAKDFYTRLFGWQLQEMPMPGGEGTYTLIQVGEGTGGGMFANPRIPSQWIAYVGVEDIRASTARARELGAQMLMDVTEVGDFGLMSMFVDPTGATLAMWQAKPRAGG